ncbi:hypothetical protein MKX03_003485 [Papaver bracteatum]|nr:hypothetical protein MKX03_003485 [Papaver bracteatum]
MNWFVNKQEIEQEVRLVVGVEEDRKKLMGKRKVTKWLDKLKIAAYEMEDVLDEWRTEIQRSQLETKTHNLVPVDADGTRNKQVLSSSYACFTASKRIALGNDIASRIKEIRETLDTIKSERDDFTFITNETSVEGSFTRGHLLTSIEHDICGREPDQQIILDKLLGPTKYQEDETPIISITGKMGVGKTSLAQLVFNHEKVRAHFQTHVWICVSDPFDVEMVKKSIIREATDNKPFDPETWLALNTKPTDALTRRHLNKELVQSINEKRFLIVLDDVWTDDPDDWLHLKLLLNDGAQGSRILVTTQLVSVASMAGPWKHNLSVLSCQDSASLLRHKVFRGVEEECEILEEICFDISLKCHGLPLDISLIGSYMNKNVSEDHWRRILESKIWELYVFHAQGLLNPAFLLSYDGLSAPLKNCFAYCALFQNDHKILKHTLIRLLMAQVGEEYFDELADRSFFQYFSAVNDGGKVYYKMHDLTQNFAKFLAFDSHYICYFDQSYTSHDDGNTSGLDQIHQKPIHMSLVYFEPDVCPSSFNDAIKLYDNNIRSVRSTSDGAQSFGSLSSDLVHHLRCVRVMELEEMGITRLPDEIDQLIHLRYLNLSHNRNLSELPNSFCNLINLQTLNLSFCASLRKLPKGRLINLINLDTEATSLEYLPKGIKGKSLQTLSSFVVSCASEGCSIEELSHLNLLQGCIRIDGLGRLKSADEAGRAELHKKNQLSQIWLDFDTSEKISSGYEWQVPEQNSEALVVGSLMESVLDVLQPHPNLEILNISSYLGFSFPRWRSNVKALRKLPVLGQLPFLETLLISYLQNLEHIGVEIYGANRCVTTDVAFPKLSTFNIEGNPNLKVWEFHHLCCKGEISIMPCLKLLRIGCCPKLKLLRFLSTSLSSVVNLWLHDLPQLEEFKFFEEEEEEDSASLLPCLFDLELLKCDKLKSFPRHLSSLSCLSIESCSSIHDLRLYIPISPNLTRFALHIQPHFSLENIAQFKELESLCFTGPVYESLHFLPETVSTLTNLRLLVFQHEDMCGEVEDWSVLSHIPQIFIGGKFIDPLTHHDGNFSRVQFTSAFRLV